MRCVTWFSLMGLTVSLASAQTASRPLAARSVAEGESQFTWLAPERTGIVTENNFADPQMWWERYLEFTVGAIGTGVAIGDYDNDGRPDLFVVGKTEQSRLFRNLGDWRFEDTTIVAGLATVPEEESLLASGLSWAKGLLGGDDKESSAEFPGWTTGATWADIDNDGDLDLMVCRFNLPNQLWVNRGDGTFDERGAATGLALVDASGMATFADYDRDGWLDVFVQTNLFDAAQSPQGQPDRLYRNRGDGTFEDVTAAAGISGITQGHAALWWDYNNDGWLDLYVANDFSAPDQLWRNQSHGEFVNTLENAVPHTPFSAMGADIGDVDNDGRIDLFVADMAASTWVKDHRGMADSRAKVDGAIDTEKTPQYLRNALYLNTGRGRLVEAAHLAGLAATDWTWSPRFADLDNDGWLDLHVTTGMVRELHNADLLQRTMISESPSARIRLMKDSPELAEPNLAYRNRGDMTFEEVGAAWGLDQAGVSFGSALGDLDGDGDLDLVYSNYGDGVTVLRNDSSEGARITVSLQGRQSNRQGIGAAVEVVTRQGRQVRMLMPVRGYLGSNEPILHFGLGEADVIDRLVVRWPRGHERIYQDLEVGRHYTFEEPSGKVQHPPHASAEPWYRNRLPEWSPPLRPSTPALSNPVDQPLRPLRPMTADSRLARGDLNRDGIDDFVVGGAAGQPTRLLISREGDPLWHPGEVASPARAANVGDGPIVVEDFNGDGRADLLVTRSGGISGGASSVYTPELWLNRGNGLEPASEKLPYWNQPTGAAVAADFDRDGDVDLILGARSSPGGYPAPGFTAWWSNQNGQLQERSEALPDSLRNAGLVTAGHAVDLDGDDWLDVILATEWGLVRAWRNLDGQGWDERTAEWGFAAAGSGWWRSLALGDFNGDDRPDIVVGNLGTNTPYQASTEEPAVMFFGRFGARRGPSRIEAVWENGVLKPRASLRELSLVLPQVKRNWRSHDAYAAASLEEVLGEAALATATRLEATEFRSGVFMSSAANQWQFVSLDWKAQLGPATAFAVAYANGDGNVDLFMAQNDFSPRVEIGRFDGGLSGLWLGDGDGGLSFVDWARSGITLRGAPRDVMATDVNGDGRIEWLVTFQNRQPVLLAP